MVNSSISNTDAVVNRIHVTEEAPKKVFNRGYNTEKNDNSNLKVKHSIRKTLLWKGYTGLRFPSINQSIVFGIGLKDRT